MAVPNGNELIGDYDPSDGANDPRGSESRKEGDDHLRGLKASLKRTFPNLSGQPSGVVNATEDELNTLVGISTSDRIDTFPSGTAMLFYQNKAPTGWTIVQAVDECSVRLTSGSDAGGQEGGHHFDRDEIRGHAVESGADLDRSDRHR